MTNRDILAIPDMGKKALKEVMEALDVYAVNMSQDRVDETVKSEHEPVAWLWKNQDGHQVLTDDPDYADGTWTPLYTAPPKREWVGIEPQEIGQIWAKHKEVYGFGIELEQVLKERNT